MRFCAEYSWGNIVSLAILLLFWRVTSASSLGGAARQRKMDGFQYRTTTSNAPMQTPNLKVLCGCINCYINCFLKIDNHYAVKHGYNKGPGTGNFDHHNLLHSLILQHLIYWQLYGMKITFLLESVHYKRVRYSHVLLYTRDTSS